MKPKFKYKGDGLSETHIQQICRFLKISYVKGEHQKWNKFAAFKLWHKELMDKRDNKKNSLNRKK